MGYAIIITILIFIFSPYKAIIAAPVINAVSGIVANGQTVVLSGTGFGTKTTAGPQVWDNFESGTIGSEIAGNQPVTENLAGSWTWGGYGYPAPVYSNTVVRTNSTKSSKHNFESDYRSSLEIDQAQSNYFFSFWLYYQKTSVAWSRNTKPFIIYGNYENYYPFVYAGFGLYPDEDNIRSNVDDSSSITGAQTIWGDIGLSDIESKWIRIDVWVNQSSANTTDGTYQVWIYNPAANTAVNLTMSDTSFATRSSSNYWRYLEVMPYSANDNPNTSIAYVDDFYLDNTISRVEICGHSGWDGSWSTRKSCEIQPAESWSETTISVNVNSGVFGLTDTAYLFVVDSDGAASSGYPITFGNGVIVPTATGVSITGGSLQ